MKKVSEFIGGCFGAAAFGALGGWVFWLGMSQDDEELKAGKSPHSGFTPDCPVWEADCEDVLTVYPNRPARMAVPSDAIIIRK